MTDIRLSLSPTGDLRLTFPEHRERTLDIPATEVGARFIQRILRDAASERRDQRGYVGLFPTQAIVNTWLRQAAVDRAAKVREEFADIGIDLDKVEFTL